MDWKTVRTPAPARPGPPAPELLATCWQLRTPRGRVLTCTLVRDAAPGVEVRAWFTEEDLLRSHRVADVARGHELAGAWRLAVIERGGFTPLP